MGYRSDVAYIIRFKDVSALREFVAVNAINEGTRDALEECDVFIGSSDDYPELRFAVDDVKWYPSFPDVQAHEELLAYFDRQEEPTAGYVFVRLGEENDDCMRVSGGDEDLAPWDALDISRSIWWEVKPHTRSDKGTVAIVSEV